MDVRNIVWKYPFGNSIGRVPELAWTRIDPDCVLNP